MVKVPFKSQQVPEKAVVESSTNKNSSLKYFCLCFPGEREGKQPAPFPSRVCLSRKHNLRSAEDPI